MEHSTNTNFQPNKRFGIESDHLAMEAMRQLKIELAYFEDGRWVAYTTNDLKEENEVESRDPAESVLSLARILANKL